MPKVAVLLNNHLRTFPAISTYIKDFYGPDVDYYASTWDHNHGYYTYEEKLDLLSPNIPFSDDLYSFGSCLPYTELNVRETKELLTDFGVKDVIVNTADEYDIWVNQIKEIKYDNWWYKFSRFGGLYTKVKGWELIQSTGIEYDIIFYNRFDVLPFLKKSTESREEVFSKLLKRNWGLHFGGNIKLTKGMIWVEDRHFFTSSTGSEKLFGNVVSKINDFIYNPLFKDDIQDYFKTHKILGSLLQLTKYRKVVELPFDILTIYKEEQNEKYLPLIYEKNKKARLSYSKLRDPKGSHPTHFKRNLWAQNFFEKNINKNGDSLTT